MVKKFNPFHIKIWSGLFVSFNFKHFNLQFTVNQRSRPRPYVSEWYLVRRGDRQSCLEVDPPLLLREDVKIEFHVSLALT